jgi:hypothetical protein
MQKGIEDGLEKHAENDQTTNRDNPEAKVDQGPPIFQVSGFERNFISPFSLSVSHRQTKARQRRTAHGSGASIFCLCPPLPPRCIQSVHTMPSTTDPAADTDAPSSSPHPLEGQLPSASIGSSPQRKQQHHQPSPLSIAVPLASRASNGASYSAGYLEHRRDTFHSLPSAASMQYHANGNVNGLNNSNNSHHISNNHGPLYWQTHQQQQQNTPHDHHSSPFSSSTMLHNINHVNNNNNYSNNINSRSQPILSFSSSTSRPQSLSYTYQHQQQHHHTPSDPEGLMRRRRPSSASSSSKQQQQQHVNGGPLNNTSFSSSTLSSSAAAASTSNGLRSKASNTPHHTRRFTTLISDQEPDTTYLWGYLLFFATMIGFTISMYALVASNYMPRTGNKVRSEERRKEKKGQDRKCHRGY